MKGLGGGGWGEGVVDFGEQHLDGVLDVLHPLRVRLPVGPGERRRETLNMTAMSAVLAGAVESYSEYDA